MGRKAQNLDKDLKFSAEDSYWGDGSTFTEDTTAGTITTAGGTTPAYLAVSYTSISADDLTMRGISGLTDPTDVAGDEIRGNSRRCLTTSDIRKTTTEEYALQDCLHQFGAAAEDAIGSKANLADTDLPAGTQLKLKFTYDFGPVRYIAVNGAEITTAFTHKMPDWEGPGCDCNHRQNSRSSSSFDTLILMVRSLDHPLV